MGKFFTTIPAFLFPWIEAQKIFWVATAPLSEDGHVNVSPKGFEGTFRVVDEGRVWYEDLTGSGVETISHLRENGRITIMFVAFEGPPRITRLFGRGTVYEYGTPEYADLLPPEKRQPGSRAVIMVDVHKVGTSCGFSIPFFTFKSHRMRLHQGMLGYEETDYDFEFSPCPIIITGTTSSSSSVEPDSIITINPSLDLPTRQIVQIPGRGLRNYWKRHNVTSIDGLPGVTSAFVQSSKGFGDWKGSGREDEVKGVKDDEGTNVTSVVGLGGGEGNDAVSGRVNLKGLSDWNWEDVSKVLVGFGLGVGVTSAAAAVFGLGLVGRRGLK